jgi:biofilm protein TabA
MQNLSACRKILLITVSILISNAAFSQTTNNKSAKKWVAKKEWANGLKLNVDTSVNAIEFAKQYQANKAVWDKAFEFMKTHNLDTIAPGKYVIDGDKAFAAITDGPNKDFDKTGWESHRKYIDLQYIIRGKEKIGVANVATATVLNPYDEKGDAAHYTTDGKYYIASPGTFFLFFPGDAHRPNIKVDGYDKVKKLVIKINYVN